MCSPGFGVRLGKCASCDDSKCIDCAYANKRCLVCLDGFGFSNAKDKVCKDVE